MRYERFAISGTTLEQHRIISGRTLRTRRCPQDSLRLICWSLEDDPEGQPDVIAAREGVQLEHAEVAFAFIEANGLLGFTTGLKLCARTFHTIEGLAADDRSKIRRVVVESPFAACESYSGEEAANYLRLCLRDSFDRKESPLASHAIGPLVLDDNTPAERRQGILAGYAWYSSADAIIFYTDLGWSVGMERAMQECMRQKLTVEVRGCFENE